MKPFIYVHELIENRGGIWIGCPSEDVVRKSHTEGETGEEVIALVKLSDAQSRIDELEEMLKWYVEEDEIHEGDPENQYWIDGKHKAMKLLGMEIEE